MIIAYGTVNGSIKLKEWRDNMKTKIGLLNNDLVVEEKIEVEISYEEYCIIRDVGQFTTNKFNKKGDIEKIYIIKCTYNLDLRQIGMIVSKNKEIL